VNGVACIDASVAVKWVVTEDDTESAIRFLGELIRTQTRLVAPMHLTAEVTSAVYRRLRLGELIREEAEGAIAKFRSIPLELLNPPQISEKAIELGLEFGWKHPYDAFYLALGEIVDCQVWTADKTFHSDAAARYQRLTLLSAFPAA